MVRYVFVLIFLCISVFAHSQFSIKGKVADENGAPLAGANVILNNATSGIVTNLSGEFAITHLPLGLYTYKISFIGFEPKEGEIELKSDFYQEFRLAVSLVMSEEVMVMATRAGSNVPVAYSNVSKEEITKNNLGQDIPYLLSMTPSLVATSDAGAGVGYTGFRIRGTDVSRINITVNGIPMNDAESHGVWWVNMPDFGSSVENIQVQRGVGTSTNGAGAFGASINMQTNTFNKDIYAKISSSAGSFNTFKNTVMAGTGLINKHFAFDLRLSKINSDGFIDRASSDLKSFFFSGGYYSKNTILKANIFSGIEKTYQSWYGIPKVRLENDTTGMRRYEEHGLFTHDETQHMMESGSRTYNYYTYKNETDNYQQDHYQLFFSQKLGEQLNVNVALHYTYGRGYYEQFRKGDNLADYLIPNIIAGSDTITTTDLVRQKWLDNVFYGTTYSLNYKTANINIILGGSWNKYDGRHFGKVIWSQYLENIPKDYEWYRSTGMKTDITNYLKINYKIYSIANLFVDMQYRTIEHDIVGIDDGFRNITQKHLYGFFNPKIGLIFYPGENQEAYFSYSIGHREPNRTNFVDADPDGPKPKAEELSDYEAGYSIKTNKASAGVSIYNMVYNNQLILTGEINDVGSALMINAKSSYRRGIELFGGIQLLEKLKWSLNATFSLNKIKNFTEYVDNWDLGGQDTNHLGTTDIAFAPGIITSSNIELTPVKNMVIALTSQYVGKQFIDNTSNSNRMLDAYLVNNLRIGYTLNPKFMKQIEFQLQINNLFNQQYETNGWVYSYVFGGERFEMDGYFPQAGINFLAGITLNF